MSYFTYAFMLASVIIRVVPTLLLNTPLSSLSSTYVSSAFSSSSAFSASSSPSTHSGSQEAGSALSRHELDKSNIPKAPASALESCQLSTDSSMRKRCHGGTPSRWGSSRDTLVIGRGPLEEVALCSEYVLYRLQLHQTGSVGRPSEQSRHQCCHCTVRRGGNLRSRYRQAMLEVVRLRCPGLGW